MILEDIDPTLRSAEPGLDSLEDGFSPPLHMHSHNTPTHPVEPDPPSPGDTGTPNPTQLPVEPEFGKGLPQAEPEDPGVPRPKI